ncbi:hypothetical protein B7494_g4211 [Chlorociboria aeruginascens]|nr:hypothetical protein B7494_g4211 [Chlorociboria aeruginascens]
MASITLKITSRSKKPISRLPTSIQISSKTTVQDVKDQLAKQAGGKDPNRLGLYDPKQKRILKDRKALVVQNADIMAGKEILVKDLGPQLSWRLVYIIEYLGPILIHALYPLFRPAVLYRSPLIPLSTSQYLSMALIILHFLKREYETIFVHKFSLNTMPARNIFKNCGHYWLLSGIYIAYFIYSPTSSAAVESPTMNYLNIAGFILWIYGEVSNAITHQTLTNLRTKGGTERGIPQGYGFGLVTCPNYMFEIVAWIGLVLISKNWSTAIFTAVGMAQINKADNSGSLNPIVPHFAMRNVTHAVFISIRIPMLILVVFGHIQNHVTRGTPRAGFSGSVPTRIIGVIAAATSYGIVRAIDPGVLRVYFWEIVVGRMKDVTRPTSSRQIQHTAPQTLVLLQSFWRLAGASVTWYRGAVAIANPAFDYLGNVE